MIPNIMADYHSRKRKPPEYPRKGTIHMKKWTNTNPMRRLLSLALSVVMVLTVLPAGALAEEGQSWAESRTRSRSLRTMEVLVPAQARMRFTARHARTRFSQRTRQRKARAVGRPNEEQKPLNRAYLQQNVQKLAIIATLPVFHHR